MPDMRASDAERERTVAQLRDRALAGRLTVEELDDRCARAYAALTVEERVVMELEPDRRRGGTRMIVRGNAPKRVRRAFAQLLGP
jgi:hypothetical protein